MSFANTKGTKVLLAFEIKENVGIQSERNKLAEALACLGIKPSTFHGLATDKRFVELENLLKDAMIQVKNDFQKRDVLGNHLELPHKNGEFKRKKKITFKDYSPYINDKADLPTILEAYQYLMKKFVINPRRYRKVKNIATAMAAFKSGLAKKNKQEMTSDTIEVLKQLRFDYEEESEDSESQSSGEYFQADFEPAEDQSLTFEIDKESANQTKLVLAQIKDMNISVDQRRPSSLNSSRRGSVILAEQKNKTKKKRRSLSIIQKSAKFQPKEEEKMLIKYQNCKMAQRRPSSFF